MAASLWVLIDVIIDDMKRGASFDPVSPYAANFSDATALIEYKCFWVELFATASPIWPVIDCRDFKEVSENISNPMILWNLFNPLFQKYNSTISMTAQP